MESTELPEFTELAELMESTELAEFTELSAELMESMELPEFTELSAERVTVQRFVTKAASGSLPVANYLGGGFATLRRFLSQFSLALE